MTPIRCRRPAKIVDVVAEAFETTPEEIRNSHGTVERRVAARLGCYEGQARLGAIGTVLRLRSTSRVSELIAECDRDVDRRSTGTCASPSIAVSIFCAAR